MEVDPSKRSNSLNYSNRPSYKKPYPRNGQIYSIDIPLEYVSGLPHLNEIDITRNVDTFSSTSNHHTEVESIFLEWTAGW